MARRRFRRQKLFRGFSSIDKIRPSTEIIDVELIKRDLLNHFHTIRGERVMRPNFGSIIWELLFEPFDESTREAIISDVETIIAAEPRVELMSLDVIEFEHGIRINVGLEYTPLDVIDKLDIEFDRRNNVQTREIRAVEDLDR